MLSPEILFVQWGLKLFSIFLHTFSCCICFHQQELVSPILISIIFFHIFIFIFKNKVQRLYIIWCHITNVVNINIYVWLLYIFLYLDVTWIKIFDIDYVIKKVVRTFFDIDFSFSAHLYTNMIISMELLINASHNI